MNQLIVVVEGQSERNFVDLLLRDHLHALNLAATAVTIPTGRAGHGGVARGGSHRYQVFENQVRNLLARASRPFVTSMMDLYQLPDSYPRSGAAPDLRGVELALDIEAAMQEGIGSHRFIPYIQVHEFEALLLTDSAAFKAYYPGSPGAAEELAAEIGDTPPEAINDGPTTAPSKRVARFFGAYDREKPTASTAIARAIGLPRMRARCPHFGEWLARLEALGGPVLAC